MEKVRAKVINYRACSAKTITLHEKILVFLVIMSFIFLLTTAKTEENEIAGYSLPFVWS